MTTVYTRNNCTACTATKTTLNRLGVPFTEVNVEDDLSVAQALVDAGWRAMPVVDTGDEAWSGFDKARLESMV